MARRTKQSVQFSEHDLAVFDGGKIHVREQPLRIQWKLEQVSTKDGHSADVTFVCSVRALAGDVDLRLLAENFLTSATTVSTGAVSGAFASVLKSAADMALREKDIDAWMQADNRQQLIDALKKAASDKGFATGLEVLAPYEVDLDSQTYREARLQHMQRLLAEQQSAGRIQHLNAAIDLLKQFSDLKAANPEFTPSHLLAQVTPRDQGETLRTLMLAYAREQETQELYLVAGDQLVRMDCESDRPAPVGQPLPDTLGPLRSVQASTIGRKRMLLVGARSGVMAVPADLTDVPQPYLDPQLQSQMGFNSAVIWNDGIWACHSEGGLVGWTRGAINSPVSTLRPDDIARQLDRDKAVGLRNLRVLDEKRLLATAEGTLMTIEDGKHVTPAPDADTSAGIVEILFDGSDVVCVHSDGTIATREAAELNVKTSSKRAGKVSAAAALPWLGATRILLGTPDNALMCVGVEDTLITQYAGGQASPRMLAASAQWVAAVSSDRQRLLLWNSWEAQKPASEIYVTGLLRHRIADLCFA